MVSGINILLVALYFIIVLIIGIVYSKKESKEDWLIAERKLGAPQTAARRIHVIVTAAHGRTGRI